MKKATQKEAIPSLIQIISDLYPVCRSITGDGLRETLQYVNRFLDVSIREVPSGTAVFDWTVPDEWNINDAFIKDSRGVRVVDFKAHNLHVVNYSEPVKGQYSLGELRPHLHTVPDQPDAVPYVTSYYNRTWGFCLSKNQLDNLEDGVYDVEIDSSLAPGSLSYGELVIPGATESEILFSCHCCHPSLANDNLSGLAVAMHLARQLSAEKNHYTYRFLFIREPSAPSHGSPVIRRYCRELLGDLRSQTLETPVISTTNVRGSTIH